MSDVCKFCPGEMRWESNTKQVCLQCGSWWGVMSGWHETISTTALPESNEERTLNYAADLLRAAYERSNPGSISFWEWMESLEKDTGNDVTP